MSWKIYCDINDGIYGDDTVESVELPGIYDDDRIEAKNAICTLVRQKARELRDEGLFVMTEDIHTGEVCATDGYSRYASYSYYSRRR